MKIPFGRFCLVHLNTIHRRT